MRELKSGVYYVDYKNIHTFLDHAREYGWEWNSRVDVEVELEDHATPKSIIPFSLDYNGKRSDVPKNMEIWSDWKWTDEHIEYYQPRKILL